MQVDRTRILRIYADLLFTDIQNTLKFVNINDINLWKRDVFQYVEMFILWDFQSDLGFVRSTHVCIEKSLHIFIRPTFFFPYFIGFLSEFFG